MVTNPVSGTMPCARPGCWHPARGDGKVGHYAGGNGPCRVKECACRAFQVPEWAFFS